MSRLRLGDSDARVAEEIRALDSLSDGTKTMYISKLGTLVTAVRGAKSSRSRSRDAATILGAISRPMQTYAALTSHRVWRPKEKQMKPLKPHTVYVTVNVVIALFKHFPSLAKTMPKDTRLLWANIAERTRDGAVGRYEDLEPTVEQQEAYIPFERIVAMRETLLKRVRGRARTFSSAAEKAKQSSDATALLVLSLYSLFPPRRSMDWAIAAVFDRASPSDALVLNRRDVDAKFPNRIVLGGGSSSPTTSGGTIVFTRYKTDAKYGKQTFPLPKELARIVELSLKLNPRRFLFQQRNGESLSNKELSMVVGRTLRGLFPDVKGSPSISMLRHSYIVAADVGNLTPRVANELASQMGHSRLQQLSYSYRIPDTARSPEPAQGPGQGAVCRLTCAPP